MEEGPVPAGREAVAIGAVDEAKLAEEELAMGAVNETEVAEETLALLDEDPDANGPLDDVELNTG